MEIIIGVLALALFIVCGINVSQRDTNEELRNKIKILNSMIDMYKKIINKEIVE